MHSDKPSPIPHSRPMLGEAEMELSAEVIASGMLIGGRTTERWRSRISGPITGTRAHLFSSGRKALSAALDALNLPPGTGVVAPTYACEAVAWAIHAAGLRVVACDSGQEWLSTPDTVEVAIDDRCGAIILAPPFGLLQSAAPYRQFGLPIIHDLCQASPQTLWDNRIPDLGEIAVLSFHPTKYLCAAGGGATFDLSGNYSKELVAIERAWRDVAPFGEIQAALGNAQLDRLQVFAERRAKLFAAYRDVVHPDVIAPLDIAMDIPASALHRMPLMLPHVISADMFARFAMHGVIVRQGVDNLIHRNLGLSDEGFPNAVRAFERTLSMPFHPSLTEMEAETVASVLAALL